MMMSDLPPEELLPVDPADRLRGKTDTPFSLPGDDEPPAAGLEQVLVQAEVDAHIFDLKSLEKSQQKKSIHNMVDLGAPAVEPLIIYLKHPDRWARMMAAEVLGKMNDPRAIPPLKEALNDTHQGVRYMAELALKEISALESAAESKLESRKQISVPQPAKVTAPLHPPSERPKRATARDEEPDTESKPEKPTAKGDTEPPRRVKQSTKVRDLLNQDLESLPGKTPEPIPASSRSLENGNVAGIESVEAKPAVVGETYSTKEETTNCPVCRQEIKADSRICPHCRARFDISLRGYCPNCHTAMEVDPFNKVCPRCGEEVIDQHFEAVLVSLGDIKPVTEEIQAEEEEVPPLPLEFKSEIEPDRSIRSGGERKSKSSTQEEFPPIDVPDLQSFTDKPLPPAEEKKQPVVETDSGKEGSYPVVDFKFKPFDEPEEVVAEEIKPEVVEKPEPVQPEKPQVKLESSLPAEEPRQIRSMFSSTVSEPEEKPSKSAPVDEPVFPPVRRFAQDGGTPMYIPEGYNSPVKAQEEPEEEDQEELQPKIKAKSASKKKAVQSSEQQEKKPSKRQPAFKVNEEEPEPEPVKKVESVFTVREYTPTPEEEVSPLAQAEVQAKEKIRREESRRGINPWLIAAPLFLISGVLAVLIYFRTTGRQIPQLNIPGVGPGLFAEPTATVTPTPEPTPTQTPRPTWVSGFIDPVMTTVENEEPDFFDNFSIPDANWGFRDGNRPALSPITIENEMLIMAISRDYGFARERKISINNFVENLDFAFAQDDQSIFELVLVGSYGSLSVHLINTGEAWEGTIKVQDPKTGDWKPVQNGVVNAEDPIKMNLTVIKNGTQLAVLVDGHPMLTYQDRALPKTMFHDYYFYRGTSDGVVTMTLDNIRIWDLDNYPNLPK
jgi:hypothetical protein